MANGYGVLSQAAVAEQRRGSEPALRLRHAGCCAAGRRPGWEASWTCPQTSQPERLPRGSSSALLGFGARLADGAPPGSHHPCRITCRPPAWDGWSPRWSWWCCPCWSSAVGCMAWPSTSPSSMMRWSGGWPGCAHPVCCRRCGCWPSWAPGWPSTCCCGGCCWPCCSADACGICWSSWSPGPCRASSSSCWRRCCAARGRSGWSSGPTGPPGRCPPHSWRRWRRSWSESCTPWSRRAAGARPASGWRPRWSPWSPSPACTWGWRHPPMCWSAWRSGWLSRCLGFAGSPPRRSSRSATGGGAARTWTSAAPGGRRSARPCRTSLVWWSRTSSRSGWPGRPAPRRYASRSKATLIPGCSASCMPKATCAPTAGTSWAGNCCTGGWKTRNRSTPCGGWSSKRTTRCR